MTKHNRHTKKRETFIQSGKYSWSLPFEPLRFDCFSIKMLANYNQKIKHTTQTRSLCVFRPFVLVLIDWILFGVPLRLTIYYLWADLVWLNRQYVNVLDGWNDMTLTAQSIACQIAISSKWVILWFIYFFRWPLFRFFLSSSKRVSIAQVWGISIGTLHPPMQFC